MKTDINYIQSTLRMLISAQPRAAFKVIGLGSDNQIVEVTNLRAGKNISLKNTDVTWNCAPGMYVMYLRMSLMYVCAIELSLFSHHRPSRTYHMYVLLCLT